MSRAGQERDELTIEDRTSEETEELDEQVLLLGGDFVPAVALAALLDLSRRDTLLDVGLEHLLGDGTRVGTSSLLLGTELVPRLLNILLDNLSVGVVGLGISVGRDVLLQSSVLVCRGVSRVAKDGRIESRNIPRSSMLPGA